jgi:hypothetical protein
VSEYLLNNCWVSNAGNHLDETGKFATNISLLEGLLMAVSAISRRPDYRLLYNRYTIESGTKSCEIANNGSRPTAAL